MWRNRKLRASKELTAKEIAALIEAAQVSEQEIRQLHEDFLDHYPSGRLDKKAFTEYYQRLHPNIGPQRSFDGNSFNESFKLTFAFDMWDVSGDGHIDQEELADVISAIYDRAGITDRKGEQDPKKRAKEISNKLDIKNAHGLLDQSAPTPRPHCFERIRQKQIREHDNQRLRTKMLTNGAYINSHNDYVINSLNIEKRHRDETQHKNEVERLQKQINQTRTNYRTRF